MLRANDGTRTGGEILVDQLLVHGVQHVFCVPGESYLPVLDALHDMSDIAVVSARHEGAAANMAEADGKLSHANADLGEARRQVTLAENAVKDSEHARERIANWPRAVETGTDIATAEAQLSRAERRELLRPVWDGAQALAQVWRPGLKEQPDELDSTSRQDPHGGGP